MFLMKKIISALVYPFSLTLIILAVGVVLLYRPGKTRTGRFLCLAALVLLVAQSAPIVSNQACGLIEGVYPPILDYGRIPGGVRWVVVLSGAVDTTPGTPVTSQNRGDTLQRTMEGIVLYRHIPGARLLLSGGNLEGKTPAAAIMADLARECGVPDKDIVLEEKSLDTEDQAALIKPMIGDDKMLLVTSAVHMPRSMMLFRKYGMNPVAAPTNYIGTSDDAWPETKFPNPRGMLNTQECAHEAYGIAWLYVKGLFGR